MKNTLEKVLFKNLIDILIAFESSSDEYIDDDFAVELTEGVIADLQRLKGIDLEKVLTMLKDLSDKEKNDDRKDFIDSFSTNAGLSEE